MNNLSVALHNLRRAIAEIERMRGEERRAIEKELDRLRDVSVKLTQVASRRSPSSDDHGSIT